MPQPIDLNLNFAGPFTFSDGPSCIFQSLLHSSSGLYLWTIRQASDGSHLIHYIGETVSFGKRHREHLIQIMGLNYGIFDPNKAQHGIRQLLWKGLWRDKSATGPSLQLQAYQALHGDVLRYISALNIFIAGLDVDNRLRKHIEGCIGWHLRNIHPEHKSLYPDDNYIGTAKEKPTGNLHISAAEVIRGLDPIIPY